MADADRNTAPDAPDRRDEPNNLLTAALAYAARGWPVLPLADRDKVPRPGSHSFKDATCDPEQIRSWWARWPNANIGLATGSGLLVLDVDGDQGRAALTGRHLPPTVCAHSGRAEGGAHYYYQGDGRCLTGLLPGVDIRGAGGYVVAAPSIHPDTGAAYAWAPGLSPDDLPLAPAPDWLTPPPSPARRTGARLPDAVPCPAATCEVSSPYGIAALRNVTRELAAAPVGTRNDRLTRAALRLGNLIGGGEVSWADAVRELREACEANGLLADEDRKATGTLYRNLGKGSLSPCGPPNVLIDRRLLSAGLTEGGLRYACLLALLGRLTQKAMAEVVDVTPEAIRKWRRAFDQADQAAGGTLTQIATERPTGNFVPAPAALLLDKALPLTLALQIRALQDDKRGVTIVRQERLAELLDVRVQAVGEQVKRLAAAGWLIVSQARFCGSLGRRLGANVYVLHDRPITGAQGLPAEKRNESVRRRPTRGADQAAPKPKAERKRTSSYTSRSNKERPAAEAVCRSVVPEEIDDSASLRDPTRQAERSVGQWHVPTDEEHAANLAAIPDDILANAVAISSRGDELLGRDPRNIRRPEDLGREYVAVIRQTIETHGADVWRELYGLPQPQEGVEVA